MTFTRCLGPFPLPGQGCPARGMGYNQPSALYLIRTTDTLCPQAVRLLAPWVLPVHASAVLGTPGIPSPSQRSQVCRRPSPLPGTGVPGGQKGRRYFRDYNFTTTTPICQPPNSKTIPEPPKSPVRADTPIRQLGCRTEAYTPLEGRLEPLRGSPTGEQVQHPLPQKATHRPCRCSSSGRAPPCQGGGSGGLASSLAPCDTIAKW